MKRLYARLSALIPHPWSHFVVASLIAALFAAVIYMLSRFGLVDFDLTGVFLGAGMFYVGREVRDLQKQHDWNMAGFDWPGFLWPVVPMLALEIVLRL